MMFIRRERGRSEGRARSATGKEEVDGVAGDVGPASVPVPAAPSCLRPSCCCLTIFGLGLRIPWLLPLSPALPSLPGNRVLRFKDITSFCVVFFPSLCSPCALFFLSFFSASCFPLRVLFTPLFPALDFHFHCNFICLPHATQSGHSAAPSRPTPPPHHTVPACACCNASVVRRVQLRLQGRILMSLLSRIASNVHVPARPCPNFLLPSPSPPSAPSFILHGTRRPLR